jgi:hypothetical protein
MLGDQIVFRTGKDGQTIVATKPSYDPNRGLSSAQIAHQEAFRQAIAYAKAAKDEPVYQLKAQGTALSSFNTAVADWFNEPEVLEIDTSAWTGAVGETIRIKAQDDVQVEKVSVVIKYDSGSLVEQGQAVQIDGLWWAYTTTQAVTAPNLPNTNIIATAQDLAGNTAELTWQGN